MPVTLERDEHHSLIRLEGECGVTSAVELKRLLLEALFAGGALRVDLERAKTIDSSILQLLWAAGREAAGREARIEIRLPETVRKIAADAGLERFPGLVVQE